MASVRTEHNPDLPRSPGGDGTPVTTKSRMSRPSRRTDTPFLSRTVSLLPESKPKYILSHSHNQ